MATSPKVDLWLYSKSNEIDILALSIPLGAFKEYAVNSLKWLKYLGYAIYGAEGRLSTSKDGPEIDLNYDAVVEIRPYYFISESQSETCRTHTHFHDPFLLKLVLNFEPHFR